MRSRIGRPPRHPSGVLASITRLSLLVLLALSLSPPPMPPSTALGLGSSLLSLQVLPVAYAKNRGGGGDFTILATQKDTGEAIEMKIDSGDVIDLRAEGRKNDNDNNDGDNKDKTGDEGDHDGVVEELRRFHQQQRAANKDADGSGGFGRHRTKNEGSSRSVPSHSSPSDGGQTGGGGTCGDNGPTSNGGRQQQKQSGGDSSSPRLDKSRNAKSSPFMERVTAILADNGVDMADIPSYAWSLPDERLAEEIDNYLGSMDEDGKRWWSEFFVLESFYFAIVGSKADDSVTNALVGNGGWLNPSINVCEWEGITCGVTTAGAGLGKFERKPDSRCFDKQRCGEDLSDCPVGMVDLGAKRNNDTGDLDLDLTPKEAERARRLRTIYCRPVQPDPPLDAVTKIDLMEMGLAGTIPAILSGLRWLHRLNLFGNDIVGTIPTELGLMRAIQFIDLGENKVTGTVPSELGELKNTLDELWLEKNKLTGTVSAALTALTVEFFDVSGNQLTGTLPTELGDMVNLGNLYFEHNQFGGTIPTELGWSPLKTLDLSSNMLTGTIPTDLAEARELVEINLGKNLLVGTIPDELFSNLQDLESIVLSWNLLSGVIPSELNYAPIVEDEHVYEKDYLWNGCPRLEYLAVDRNRLIGTVPPDFFIGVSESLKGVSFSHNELTGSIPSQIGYLRNKKLKIDLANNDLTGTVPWELGEVDLAELNLTNNALTGTVPESLCQIGSVRREHDSLFYGCDSILCPPGTFHPDGVANDLGACRKCEDFQNDDDDEYIPIHTLLGQTKCLSTEYVIGDTNGDGVLDEREILRFLSGMTIGYQWGEQFRDWNKMNVDKCDLSGVTCKDGHVIKIDLREALLCGNENGEPGPISLCRGLPAELEGLEHLEVFDISDNPYLRGTLPKEFFNLKRLKILDMSECPGIEGSIPTEIGKLKNLRVLNLSEGKWTGKMPSEIGELRMLEKLNLGLNPMEGSIPETIGNLVSIKEILLSRTHLSGAIPASVGRLRTLENLELYGNSFDGPLPNLSHCVNLKRIDTFNNQISGPFPESLTKLPLLQIVHLKNNLITGTLPNGIGSLPMLSWLDITSNQLRGTIPASLGTSQSLRDLRIGGNMFVGPVPESLCTNTRVNGGLVKKHGCDAIVCPLGKYTPMGFTNDASYGCFNCPHGQTTQYLGSMGCKRYTQREFLSMFFDVTGGREIWPDEHRRGWKDPKVSECNWAGVSCDENGEVNGLTFPVAALEGGGDEAFKIYARSSKATI